MKRQTKGYLMVAVAGTLWGTTGIQVKTLFNYQISVQTIILWKMIFAILILFPFIFFTNRKILKVDLKGLIYISLLGIIIHVFSLLLYFSAIQKTSIATAATLLYTAPIFIAIMARIFFKERFSPFKIAALLLCIGGCFFAATGGSLATLNLNLLGVLIGLGAGFTFALLTIISKAIINDYHQLTITIYSIILGLLFYFPFSTPWLIFQIDFNLNIWLLLFSLGLFSTALAYGLYIIGLSYNIEISKAGIVSTLELVVSAILSYLVFKEALWGWKLVGILMVVFSVIIVQVDKILPLNNKFSYDKILNP